MRRLRTNNHADVKMIGAVVGILITLIVSILVFYNIASSIDASSLDSAVNTSGGGTHYTDASNATTDILDQAGTFFQIAPIIAIVVVAVVILGYVGRIGGA